MENPTWHNPHITLNELYQKSQETNLETYKTSEFFLTELKKIIKKYRFWWDEPLINVSEYSEVVCEWWHKKKKISVYIEDKNIEYIKVWGADVDNEMEEGIIQSLEDIKYLWQWINE